MLAKPTINNTSITDADTEYSYTFPAGTKGFRIKLESLNALLKVSFTEGSSGTEYITIPYGESMKMKAKVGGSTIYFQSPSASQVAQIETWK